MALSPATINRLGLTDGEPVSGACRARVKSFSTSVSDPRIPDGCAWLPTGVPATAALDAGLEVVELDRP